MNSHFLIDYFVPCDSGLRQNNLSYHHCVITNGVNSRHLSHYTMALADSKFDYLSVADIDSLLDDANYSQKHQKKLLGNTRFEGQGC